MNHLRTAASTGLVRVFVGVALALAASLAVADSGAGPKRGFFGLTPHLEGGEVTVIRLTPGAPAEAAGIRVGDVIVLLDGEPPLVTPQGGVVRGFTRYRVGDEVELLIRRDDELKTYRVTLAEVPPPTREDQARLEAIERRARAGRVIEEMFRTLDEFELTFSKDGRLLFREKPGDSWEALDPEVAEAFEAVARSAMEDRKTQVLRLRVQRQENGSSSLIVVDR